MIIGIGCDIVEVARIEKALAKESFVEKTFTEKEIEYCESKKAHKYESYAACFAAKEATGKAFGTGIFLGDLQKIEVTHNKEGQPAITLHGDKQARQIKIHLSLSHTSTLALAEVVVEEL